MLFLYNFRGSFHSQKNWSNDPLKRPNILGRWTNIQPDDFGFLGLVAIINCDYEPSQIVFFLGGKLCKTSNAHCSIRSCRPRGEVKTTSRQGKQCAAASQFGGALSDPCNSLRLTTGQRIKTYQDISKHDYSPRSTLKHRTSTPRSFTVHGS